MARDAVAVRIAGHEYKIRSEGDAESLREIAAYVDQAMSRVRERTRTVDSLDVAVLTCLNLAREILALHGERAPSGSTAVDEVQLRGLIERVEVALGREASEESDAEEASATPTTTQAEASSEAPRTLDLPSMDALRERAAARSEESGEGPASEELPEARVASGGRDRAS